LANAQAKSIHKHSAIVKEVTGDRLEKYSIFNELDFCIEKGYAVGIDNVWKIDDMYVTLSMCSETENRDIQTKINERIQNIK